jgi:FkbM family methyltransferase
MSQMDRFIGLVRSFAVYYSIPFRQRRLRVLYGQFVKSDDLVFDVGAHLGNRTRAFVALGCQVVAVEPQPHVAAVLRRLTRRLKKVRVVERALSSQPGYAKLAISERTPTVSTIEQEWREARRREAGFGGVQWNTTVEVQVTTLDALVKAYGVPAFIKIDVEGGELNVLRGMSQAVPALSFEFLPAALDTAEACVRLLEQLGPYQFNWSMAESSQLARADWTDGPTLLRELRQSGFTRHGDIYARLRRSAGG